MRRSFVVTLLLLLLLALPCAAKAQAAVTLESLDIQVWPEYDQPSVLVIYDLKVAADSPLPATLNFRLPGNAEVLAIARNEGGELLTVPAQPPATQGNTRVITFTITNAGFYRIEYYMPYSLNGSTRNFTVTWPGDYATGAISFLLQEPVEATNFVTNPVLDNVGPHPDGLIYRSATFPGLAAGQSFSLEVSYEKETDTLSASAAPVEPSGSLDGNISGQASYTTYLPWFLGGVGLLLIVGAVIWYWVSGRSGSSSPRRRKRHVATDDEVGDEGTQRYCSQCGKRAQSGDRFCRACGARLKRSEE